MLRVTVERSGGLAGLRVASQASSDGLSAEAGQKLSSLVEAAGFFHLPEVLAPARQGADRFQYKIGVESEGQSHTIAAEESALPAELRELVNWVLTNGERK